MVLQICLFIIDDAVLWQSPTSVLTDMDGTELEQGLPNRAEEASSSIDLEQNVRQPENFILHRWLDGQRCKLKEKGFQNCTSATFYGIQLYENLMRYKLRQFKDLYWK